MTPDEQKWLLCYQDEFSVLHGSSNLVRLNIAIAKDAFELPTAIYKLVSKNWINIDEDSEEYRTLVNDSWGEGREQALAVLAGEQ